MRTLYIIAIILIFVLATCKKVGLTSVALAVTPVTGTRMQFTLDSIYLYASQIYLWYNTLPSYTVFDPRTKYDSITPAIDAFDKELYDITQTAINPQTGVPYEQPVYTGTPKYSFIEQPGKTGDLAVVLPIMQPAVIKDTVLTSKGKAVAYIALGSFPALSECKSALDAAFAMLAAANPQQAIIDLRVNGGGYVETAQYVADLVAPASLTGKTMFSEQYNTLLQNGQTDLLKYQPYLDESGKPVTYKGRNATMADVDYSEAGNTFSFKKSGGLTGIQSVYFIVSGRTASASELLISVLKPYLKEALIGETTYGKPVGFFPVGIEVYSLYLSAFLIKNAQGWSDYFNGMAADIPVPVDASPDWGNPQDTCVSMALAAIDGKIIGNMLNMQGNDATKNKTITSIIIDSLPCKGIIENRFHLKL